MRDIWELIQDLKTLVVYADNGIYYKISDPRTRDLSDLVYVDDMRGEIDNLAMSFQLEL